VSAVTILLTLQPYMANLSVPGQKVMMFKSRRPSWLRRTQEPATTRGENTSTIQGLHLQWERCHLLNQYFKSNILQSR